MKKEFFQILVKVGGVGKKEKRDVRRFKEKYREKHDFLGGYVTHCVRKDSGERVFKVFLNGRQADSEFIDSFYHEMTHILCGLFRVKQDENMCRWIGYISKVFWGHQKGKQRKGTNGKG